MKVLFCDIDGVLNSLDSWKRTKDFNIATGIDPYHVKFLNHIIQEIPELFIVISSTWRVGETPSTLYDMLVKNGINIKSVDYVGRTEAKGAPIRGIEIDKWISENNVDNYCIVDDDQDMLYKQRNNFVKINGNRGLTEKQANRVIKILQKESYKK